MARILIVDDHEENRGVLTTLLRYAGHDLFEAPDGEKALEEARARRPDLVITDIVMPKLDGWGFVRSLRSDPDIREIPVIFYSALRLNEEAFDAAIAEGVSTVLSKPIEPEAVLETIDRTLKTEAGKQNAAAELPLTESELNTRIRVLSTKLWQKVQELETGRAELEERVKSRTAELEVANRELQQEISERRLAEAELREVNKQLSARAYDLEHRTHEVKQLTEMSELLQACQDVNEAQQVTIQFARKLFPANSGGLYLARDFGDGLEAFATWGPSGQEMKRLFLPEECWALRRGRSHLVEDLNLGAVCDHIVLDKSAGFICVPMMTQGQALGVLHVSWSEAPTSGESSHLESIRRLAIALADNTALALSNVRLREKLKEQTIRDPLTGLFNRRYLEESLDREVSRARRAGARIGIIMADIDHFKHLNDSFGHPTGDAVLRSLGRYLRSRVRPEDIATRYGGEEFALILPGASLDISRQRAESLRTGVRTTNELAAVGDTEIQKLITLSLGVAVFPDHGSSSAGILQAADEALYSAKRSGRDCVVVAADGKAEQMPTQRVSA